MPAVTDRERTEHWRIHERDWRLGMLWRFGQFGCIVAKLGAISLLIALTILAFNWRVVLGPDPVKSDRPTEEGVVVITAALAMLAAIPLCGLLYHLSVTLQDLAFWLAGLSDHKLKWRETTPLEETLQIAKDIRRLTLTRFLVAAGWLIAECFTLFIHALAIFGVVGLLYSGAMFLIVSGTDEASFSRSPISIATLSIFLLLVAGVGNLAFVAMRDTRARLKRRSNKSSLMSD